MKISNIYNYEFAINKGDAVLLSVAGHEIDLQFASAIVNGENIVDIQDEENLIRFHRVPEKVQSILCSSGYLFVTHLPDEYQTKAFKVEVKNRI